jgi:hypothetical protein
MTETTSDNGSASRANSGVFVVAAILVLVFIGAMVAHLALRLVELAWRVT